MFFQTKWNKYTFSKLLKEIGADFLTKEPFNPDSLYLLNPNDHFVLQKKTPQSFGNELQERVCSSRTKASLERFKGCRDREEKCSSLRLLTANVLICRNKCAEGLKVAYIERKCTETVWLSCKSTVNIVRGFNGQTYAYFLPESSCFDEAQIHLVSSIKHGEEERGTAGGEEGRLQNRS